MRRRLLDLGRDCMGVGDRGAEGRDAEGRVAEGRGVEDHGVVYCCYLQRGRDRPLC